MTDFKKNGLVIHENDYGENDKLLVILTERYGKIPVIAKGAKSVRNRHMACCQLLLMRPLISEKRVIFTISQKVI